MLSCQSRGYKVSHVRALKKIRSRVCSEFIFKVVSLFIYLAGSHPLTCLDNDWAVNCVFILIWRFTATWRRVAEAGPSSSGDSTALWTSRGAGGSTKWSVNLTRATNALKCLWVNLFSIWPRLLSLLQGFGDVLGEHWLGNEVLYLLTSQGQYSLRVELKDWEGSPAHSQYDRFTLSSEQQQYRWHLPAVHSVAISIFKREYALTSTFKLFPPKVPICVI